MLKYAKRIVIFSTYFGMSLTFLLYKIFKNLKSKKSPVNRPSMLEFIYEKVFYNSIIIIPP